MAAQLVGEQLLDHGYIRLIETWGSDERIVEAARMSTDGAFRGWGPKFQRKHCGHTTEDCGEVCSVCNHRDGTCQTIPGDEKLLAYLYNNNHSTPFEMAGVVFEVQAPIMVFREWHRHRTQSFNELSARYTALPALYYMPTLERVMINASGSNKQAGRMVDADELTEDTANQYLNRLAIGYEYAERDYQAALSAGIPKELARCIMPVGHYSRMRASANLRNWLAFMTLRSAENAQWEIRQYSNSINRLLVPRFPRTMELFNAS